MHEIRGSVHRIDDVGGVGGDAAGVGLFLGDDPCLRIPAVNRRYDALLHRPVHVSDKVGIGLELDRCAVEGYPRRQGVGAGVGGDCDQSVTGECHAPRYGILRGAGKRTNAAGCRPPAPRRSPVVPVSTRCVRRASAAPTGQGR